MRRGRNCMNYTGTRGVFISLLSAFLLNACGTEGLGTDSTSTQLTSGSSSSKSCNLTEIITSADRKAASGDVQCSTQTANADSYFAAAVSLCESGKDYTSTYNQYKQIADYAKEANASIGCGSQVRCRAMASIYHRPFQSLALRRRPCRYNSSNLKTINQRFPRLSCLSTITRLLLTKTATASYWQER